MTIGVTPDISASWTMYLQYYHCLHVKCYFYISWI